MRWRAILNRRDTPHDTPPEAAMAVSVDLVYEQVVRTMDAQHDQITAIDTKVGFVLTAASIVIGFQGLPGVGNTLGVQNPLWLAPAFVIYIALLSAIIQAYRLREFKSRGLEPSELQTYYYESTEFTKRQFVATLRSAYEQNLPRIDEKVCWLQRAERLLVAEVIALVIGGALSHEWHHINQAAVFVYNRFS